MKNNSDRERAQRERQQKMSAGGDAGIAKTKLVLVATEHQEVLTNAPTLTLSNAELPFGCETTENREGRRLEKPCAKGALRADGVLDWDGDLAILG